MKVHFFIRFYNVNYFVKDLAPQDLLAFFGVFDRLPKYKRLAVFFYFFSEQCGLALK